MASVGLGDLGRLARGCSPPWPSAPSSGPCPHLSRARAGRYRGLAPTLGLALGWLSWGAVAFGLFTSFLLGGLAGLAAIGLLGLTRKSLLPFGPWLVAGALLGVLAGADVAAGYASTLVEF